MTTQPMDPLAAAVHLHLEQLRREAAADALARTLRARRSRWSWPGSVAAALRESFTRSTSRRAEPCPTC